MQGVWLRWYPKPLRINFISRRGLLCSLQDTACWMGAQGSGTRQGPLQYLASSRYGQDMVEAKGSPRLQRLLLHLHGHAMVEAQGSGRRKN